MGKTYKKQNHRYYDDDEQTSGRSGKHSNHSNNRKSGGMKTLNSYVDPRYGDSDEDDYDLNDDAFDDNIEFDDKIYIQHTKNTKP